MADTPGDRTPEESQKRVGKSAAAFRTISEVSIELDVPQHVLRFWETKFSQVKPLKRAGGRRYYRPEDVELLRRIRDLLYRDGFTIKGAQKFLREGGAARASAAPMPVKKASSSTAKPAPAAPPAPAAGPSRAQGGAGADREALKVMLRELTELRELLRRHLR
ncbi:MAG TPA: MerR family transcriptional regulator [Alphaproteobacteria bacterium]|nr:MerR family transcriptional regulator [Alphaproteobacteria bacterium]